MRFARVRAYDALGEAAELFLQAVDEAEDDREILAVAHEGVATCFWRLYERLDEAVEHAELAAELALELGDEALAGEALGTRLVAESLLGRERPRQRRPSARSRCSRPPRAAACSRSRDSPLQPTTGVDGRARTGP